MSDDLFPATEITDWFDREGIAVGQAVHAERLVGGSSNVMFRVRRGDRRMVLRRPPRVAVARSDDGMRREYRVLRALNGTDVPHPTAVALCDDVDVIGCAFYVMDEVDGGPATELSSALGPTARVRTEVTIAVVDSLAALHDVDWRARGLDGFGTPEGFHERQVARWSGQHEREGGRESDQVLTVGRWLEQHMPAEWTPSIMHGDYHMLNVLIAPDPPTRVVAIVDWETATIGDPLLDLAGLCENWTGAFQGEGWPTRAEMVDRYASARALEVVPDLRYYEVLHNFRLGVLLEGVYQRSRRDHTRADNDMAGERALYNLNRAVSLVAEC